MEEVDFERVKLLMDVVHGAATLGPKVKLIADAATAELVGINEALRPVQVQSPMLDEEEEEED